MMRPPQPKKIPKIHIAHGDERIDDYYWLRDDTRKNPEIISYLEEENKYFIFGFVVRFLQIASVRLLSFQLDSPCQV